MDPFPGSPSRTGASDVPFATTFNFGFRTFFTPVLGVDANLSIISQSDLLNLVAAANVPLTPGTGVVSGVVLDLSGNKAQGVTFLLTDIHGKPVGDVFYNSLGGVPNFVQTAGTDETGVFTIFNVPPGEVYLKAMQGGRGNTRLVVFPDSISLVSFRVLPVVVARIGVASIVTEVDNLTPPLEPVGVSTVGIIADEDGDGVLNPNDFCPGTGPVDPVDLRGCSELQSPTSPLDIGLLGASGINGLIRFIVGSESTFLIKLFDDEIAHIDTYNELDTELSQLAQTQAPDLTRFLTVVRKDHLALFASKVGVTIGPNQLDQGLLGGKAVIIGTLTIPDGTTRSQATVTITNAAGEPLEALGGSRVFYFDDEQHPDPTMTSTGKNGQFIAFNVPIEPLFITATADIFGNGTVESYVRTGVFVPIPNSVYIKNMLMLQIPLPDDRFPNIPPRFSVGVSGKVAKEDEVTPVPDAQVSIAGSQAGPYSTNDNGIYSIPQSPNPKTTGPALAFGAYLLKVSHPLDYLDTYNAVALGVTTAATPAKDLRIYHKETIDNYATAIGGQTPGLGVVTGRIFRNSDNRTSAGVSIDAKDRFSQSLPVLYFNEMTGLPDANLTATTRNGRYIVFNVPPGVAFITVTSTDDTGNAVVVSFKDSVTDQDIRINDAPPPAIKAKGTVKNLTGAPESGVALSALGGDPIQTTGNNIRFYQASTDSYGNFEAEVAPFNELVIRALKDPIHFYPTFNFNARTLGRNMEGADMVIASRNEIDRLRLTEPLPIQQNPVNGIIVGDAIIQGLGNPVVCCSEAIWTGSQPVATLTALFNEDAIPDLAVLNQTGGPNGSGTVEIFFGDGNGGFRAPTSYPVMMGPTAMTGGDFNNDGNTDLVVVNAQSNSLSILMGSKSGRFPSTPIGVLINGLNPVSVAIGDANGDLNQDLFVANRDSNTVNILLGDGRGDFSQTDPYAQPIPLPLGCSPNMIAVTVLDTDTLPDWVISCETGNRLDFLYSNRGNSKFETTPIPVVRPTAIAVSDRITDFNQDGGADIAVVGSDPNDPSKGVLFVLMSNFGRLNPPPPNFIQSIGADPTSVKIGDFNGDGRGDLAVTDHGDENVKIFLGTGTGTFQTSPISRRAGISPRGIAVGDLNINGSDDLAVVDSTTNQLNVLLGQEVPAVPNPQKGFSYKVEALDLGGQPVGDVRYITPEGTLTTDSSKSSGRFLILNAPTNVPPGIIFLKTFEGSAGNKIITVYPDSVSYTRISVVPNALPFIPVLGVTLDAVARPIGDADIAFLGAGFVTFSAPILVQDGSVAGGADYEAFLDPNSEYIVKLTKVGGGGLPPVPGDFDFDSIPDNLDDCPGVFNPDQTDTDGDNIGDECDPTPTLTR